MKKKKIKHITSKVKGFKFNKSFQNKQTEEYLKEQKNQLEIEKNQLETKYKSLMENYQKLKDRLKKE